MRKLLGRSRAGYGWRILCSGSVKISWSVAYPSLLCTSELTHHSYDDALGYGVTFWPSRLPGTDDISALEMPSNTELGMRYVIASAQFKMTAETAKHQNRESAMRILSARERYQTEGGHYQAYLGMPIQNVMLDVEDIYNYCWQGCYVPRSLNYC